MRWHVRRRLAAQEISTEKRRFIMRFMVFALMCDCALSTGRF